MTRSQLVPILALVLVSPLLLGKLAAAEKETPPTAVGGRRALVVGIGQYRLPGGDPAILARRKLVNLSGAGNDALAMTALLTERGYEVATLLDGNATREAILGAISGHLEGAARSGSDLVFYFAGHGSQMAGDPGEPDGLDETLVPADAAQGAPDLRDDELRARLWRLLERGARLTVVVDACHSGSALRGLPASAATRYAEPSLLGADRPAAPGTSGPPLESGDALVLAAAQDDQSAFETGDGRHGLFTQSLLQVLATADPEESAAVSLRRIESLILANGRNQHPVLAGAPGRFAEPLFTPLGSAARRQAAPPAAVVISIVGDRLELQGGTANGLRVGDELERAQVKIRLERVDPVRSSAQRLGARFPVAPGEAFVRRAGISRHQPDLEVSFEESPRKPAELILLAEQIEKTIVASGRTWVNDPWKTPPSHVIRFEEKRGWLLAGRQGELTLLGKRFEARDVGRLPALLPADAEVFLQLPLPAGSTAAIELGSRTRHDAIEKLEDPDRDPHYQLVGRHLDGRLTYSWSRSEVGEDSSRQLLPVHTRELFFSPGPTFGAELTSLAVKLATIRFWLTLEGAPEDRFPYRLALRDPDSGHLRDAAGGQVPQLEIGELYGLALLSERPLPAQRYVYVFLLGADGRRTLIFPRPGYGGENRLPIAATASLDLEQQVTFGAQPLIRIREPEGLETYVLLTTDAPIVNPMALDESGPRAPQPEDHPLVRFLQFHQFGQRDGGSAMPVAWSIDRLVVQVVPQGGREP